MEIIISFGIINMWAQNDKAKGELFVGFVLTFFDKIPMTLKRTVLVSYVVYVTLLNFSVITIQLLLDNVHTLVALLPVRYSREYLYGIRIGKYDDISLYEFTSS